MKVKKYLSVIIAIALVWGLMFLSGRIDSNAFNIFTYVADGLILIALIGYMIYLHGSVMNKLTDKLKPEECLKAFHELDGAKYASERYLYEAMSYILLENYEYADASLRNLFAQRPTADNLIKADAINVLYCYFLENREMTENAAGKLKNDYSHLSPKMQQKYAYMFNFAETVRSLVSDEETPVSLAEKWFNSAPKKTHLEAYILNLIIGEVKLKSGDKEQAKNLFENVYKNCGGTILYKKAAAFSMKTEE